MGFLTAMTSTLKRGILVAVANPEGVAPLMAIAFAASDPGDEPPPRVLALVGQRSAVADIEAHGPQEQSLPPPPALKAAIEYARARGVTIDAQTMRSNAPALDIIATACAAEVAWTLLGYHRAASGGDTLGGVVREVFVKAKRLPISIGAFIQGTDRPFERVFAAIDAGPDGRAALELGARIAHNNRSRLRALLISNDALAISATQPDAALVDMIHDARARMGRLFHTDVLTERSRQQLFRQSPGRLLIVGKRFADEIGLPLDEVPDGDRCVIVVQGANRE
ncbi:MAG TPA: hypothetical protein VNE82_19630 [Candidatus Binataceae bacterium]|nr:hypothetical protein [Candidatus Binataceae bacterium]